MRSPDASSRRTPRREEPVQRLRADRHRADADAAAGALAGAINVELLDPAARPDMPVPDSAEPRERMPLRLAVTILLLIFEEHDPAILAPVPVQDSCRSRATDAPRRWRGNRPPPATSALTS